MKYPTTVVVGDTHFPFVVWRTVDRIVDAIKQLQPKHVIQIGDLYDLYAWSKFPRSHNVMTPHHEIKTARKDAEHFWDRLIKAAPKAKRWQLKGNHDARPFKRVMEAVPELEGCLNLDRLWQFDGVETLASDRDDLVIQKVCYQHGFRKFGEHVKHNRMSTVCGHLHTGGVVYTRLGKETLFELNAGFCGNPNSVPLSYTAQKRFSNWTQGFALITDLGPQFCPLPNP